MLHVPQHPVIVASLDGKDANAGGPCVLLLAQLIHPANSRAVCLGVSHSRNRHRTSGRESAKDWHLSVSTCAKTSERQIEDAVLSSVQLGVAQLNDIVAAAGSNNKHRSYRRSYKSDSTLLHWC